MTVSPVCLYPNVNGGSRFNLSSTDIAGLVKSWILFRRDMAARGIPWIPEFWKAIIFIVCQGSYSVLKLSEICGGPGFLFCCDWFMRGFSGY